MTNDPDEPQVVASALNEQEAHMLASHLESMGISAHVWGANSTIAWPEIPRDVQVVVRNGDVTRAKDALDQLRDRRM